MMTERLLHERICVGPLAQRWAWKVKVTDGCWPWLAATSPQGYGVLSMTANGKTVPMLAHRIAYQLFIGAIPKGLYVCHHCDNKRCVRPDHLFLGTQADNIADVIRKGRPIGRPARKLASAKE